MGFLFNEIVYLPLYNLLVVVYNWLPFKDFGVAIIVVTIIIKLALIHLSKKQIESQKKMQEIQPKMKEIQEKYKNDKEKQSRALMAMYKESGTNPMSGCLPMILQLIFLIAIYRVFYNISISGLQVDSKELYEFVANPGQINRFFLGFIDLSTKFSINNLNAGSIAQVIMILGAAAAQYFQAKMLMAKNANNKKTDKEDFSQAMSKQMLYLGPILTLMIGFQFPAGLTLYWLVSTLFMIAQQYYVEYKVKKAALVN